MSSHRRSGYVPYEDDVRRRKAAARIGEVIGGRRARYGNYRGNNGES
jgi:hypothetical protein